MPAKLKTLLKPGKSLTITFHQNVPIPPNSKIVSLAIEIIPLQAWVETFRAIVFLKITRKSAVASAEMLDELITNSKKAELIYDEVKEHLSERGYKVISALFELADRVANHRNKLAHTLWGSIAEYPDRLLTFDSRIFVKAHAKVIELHAQGKLTDKDGVEKQQVFIDNADVYTESDLLTMIRELRFVLSKFEYLDMGLEGPEFIREPMYSTLAGEPQIREILERENKKADRNPNS